MRKLHLCNYNRNEKFIHKISAPVNASTNGDIQNGVNGNHQQHHQIVLLANEKLEMSDSDEKTQRDDERKTSNGVTDEELTSLAWLHDKNLLKGMHVTIFFRVISNYLLSRYKFVMHKSSIS